MLQQHDRLSFDQQYAWAEKLHQLLAPAVSLLQSRPVLATALAVPAGQIAHWPVRCHSDACGCGGQWSGHFTNTPLLKRGVEWADWPGCFMRLICRLGGCTPQGAEGASPRPPSPIELSVTVRRCLCLVCSTALVAQTPHRPCACNAVAAQTLPCVFVLPSQLRHRLCSVVPKTVPFPCGRPGGRNASRGRPVTTKTRPLTHPTPLLKRGMEWVDEQGCFKRLICWFWGDCVKGFVACSPLYSVPRPPAGCCTSWWSSTPSSSGRCTRCGRCSCWRAGTSGSNSSTSESATKGSPFSAFRCCACAACVVLSPFRSRPEAAVWCLRRCRPLTFLRPGKHSGRELSAAFTRSVSAALLQQHPDAGGTAWAGRESGLLDGLLDPETASHFLIELDGPAGPRTLSPPGSARSSVSVALSTAGGGGGLVFRAAASAAEMGTGGRPDSQSVYEIWRR